MSSDLDDELTSINAIYSSALLPLSTETPIIHALTFPSLPSLALRIEFPPEYPDIPPSILGTQSVGDGVPKGAGDAVVHLARAVLGEVYSPGMPCVFDLIGEVDARVSERGGDVGVAGGEGEEGAGKADGVDGQPSSSSQSTGWTGFDDGQPEDDFLSETPPWTVSDVVSERKSVFVARSAPVTSVDQAKQYLAHLIFTDKKVAKATHNITAWRIRAANGVQFQDCDDDGETAAGGRVLHLLELMGVWDVMVVVTRWYGGVQLGPDRFRIINQTARDALVKGGHTHEGEKGSGKRKGKK